MAFSFVFFAGMCLGYLPLLIVSLPLCLLCPDEFQRFNRRMTRLNFSLVIRLAELLKLIEVHYEDHASPQGQLLVANHISLLDVLFILSRYQNCFTFVHGKFLRNPLIGPIIRAAGYIAVDRSDIIGRGAAFMKARDMIAKGCTLVVFPEGTRSKSGTLGEMENGVFRLAAELAVEVAPIFITSSRPLLNKTKGSFCSTSAVKFVVHRGAPIPPPPQPGKIRPCTAWYRQRFIESYHHYMLSG
jgi:1-acyl-sn-glycerol-3-phosphate acyltransferase